MPKITTSNMFYLGKFNDYDPDESNSSSENILNFEGTVVNKSTLEYVTITESDQNNDGIIVDNDQNLNANGDSMSYTVGGVSHSNVGIDSTFSANVRVTLGDGSTKVFQAIFFQAENGDVFLGDYANNGSADNLNIQSVEVLNITGGGGGKTPFSGLYTGSSADNSKVVCFQRGTEILSDSGPVKIEMLKVGDLIKTQSRGFQPIRWIGSRRVTGCERVANENLHPIRICAGSLGRSMPKNDLIVSRQHRILVTSKVAKRMFGTPEALIAAIRLAELPGVYVDPEVEDVKYFHVLFDQHEVIYANGMPAESLYLGAEALVALTPAARKEIQAIFPNLATSAIPPKPANNIPSPKLQKKLVARHMCETACKIDPLRWVMSD